MYATGTLGSADTTEHLSKTDLRREIELVVKTDLIVGYQPGGVKTGGSRYSRSW
jgi:hypothetical protein